MSNYRNVTGLGALSAALQSIPAEMRTHILEDGVKGVVGVMLPVAKVHAKASERTGALQASLTTKTINYPAAGKVFGAMGPARGRYVGLRGAGRIAARRAGPLLALAAAAEGALGQPSKYAHLVERGHIAANGRLVPAKPFIRPAVVGTTAAQGAAFFDGVAKGYDRALRKLNTA